MKIFADTSALVAWFHPADPFASRVTAWCRDKQPDFFWNIFLRAELPHNLRKLSGRYAAIAWHAYRASEGSKRLQLDMHSAVEILERGDELSARHASRVAAGTWDYLHVAAAQRLGAEVFVTCDAAQADLAQASRIKRVQLFKL